MTAAASLAGSRFHRLTVISRHGSDSQGRATWLCICECGSAATAITTQLRSGKKKSCGCLNGPKRTRRQRRSDIAYRSAHQRVERDKGRASEHHCVDCVAPAAHWSYDGTDPSELIDKKTGCAYSCDPGRYVPRCVPCHRKHDAKSLAA